MSNTEGYTRPSKTIAVSADISIRVFDRRNGWLEIKDRDNGSYTEKGTIVIDFEYLHRLIVALGQAGQEVADRWQL